MKKVIFFSLAILMIALLLIFTQQRILNNDEKTNKIEVKEEVGFEMSGYYYFGYLDEREKLDQTLEKEYLYMMDTQFQTYYQSMFQLFEDDENLNEGMINYFESIGGLRLYSIPATDSNFKNGDYITLFVKGPIQESYPAVITKLEKAEILYPRN